MVDIACLKIQAPRLQALRPELVNSIAASMKAEGQLVPIEICPSSDPALWWLADGNHRCAAAQKLGWKQIRAEVREGLSAADLVIHEITANLVRGELSPAERSLQTAKLKELSGLDSATFIRNTAKATGRYPTTIQGDMKRGGWSWVNKLIGTKLDKAGEIESLAELPIDRRDELIDRAQKGEKVSARAELDKALVVPSVTRADMVKRGKSRIRAWKKEYTTYPEFAEIVAAINAWEGGRGGFLEIGESP